MYPGVCVGVSGHLCGLGSPLSPLTEVTNLAANDPLSHLAGPKPSFLKGRLAVSCPLEQSPALLLKFISCEVLSSILVLENSS